MPENDQLKHEMLSAFIDAEQSDAEIAQVVDKLLNDSAFKDQYIRMQLVNDSLGEQIEQEIINCSLRDRIATSLDDLPAHYVEDAVQLQVAATDNVPQSHWFRRIMTNKLVSGVSVAASVMFATLLTLQTFNSQNSESTVVTIAATDPQPASLIQSQPELPISLAASASGSYDSADSKQRYQWIEADPALSRHIRRYVDQHDTNRAVNNLQPKIRTATYQMNK